ncbi:MAG TPA: hypothetical protein VNR42_00300 [Solirubrobacteraceae bacterium]|nr:hypothetical protein [Solirubrobacteraceae bacterium]
MMSLQRKHFARMLAAGAISALITPSAALAATQTYTAPKFPVPASARVQPTTGGTVVAPTGAAGAPTAKSTLPQTSTTIPATTNPATAATTPAPAASVPATGARQGTPKASNGSSELSTPAAIAAALAALLALGCAIWGIARLQAYEPRWTLSLRHTFAEAGFRASATWAEFSDWARLGR